MSQPGEYGTRDQLRSMKPDAQILVRADRLARLLDVESAAIEVNRILCIPLSERPPVGFARAALAVALRALTEKP